ncbi:protein kinase domain-containing protein [Microbispora sp. ATCC PTA-5024]|uniref:protein kinase domain-containing protein n=1 Tax=Microbispora sp. ATCC PTA-5024 TaxID=316330 RepID=UPI0004245866|nr:serine/threonine-protein kinase [Microbispora sp. ATCC PTA-5024]
MARGGTGPHNGMPPGVRPLTVGDPVIIGRYLLLGRLGTGGMGVVYLAEHPQGGCVALKTPHPVHLSDPTLRARFAEEVAFSRRVTPFCTAAVIEDGLDRDRPYLVTEYIPGPALSQVVAARGPLTPDLAYGVALGAAAALVATHEAGLVHRDLKPANVLLSPRGPFVIDFGIARDVEVDVAVAHTQAGQIMGSPGWVAPERLTGGHALPASDVFSWGCLVAFASTGLHPFGTGELDVLTRRILVEEPRISAVPKMLWDSVAAALAKDPADRPDAAALLTSLLAAGGIREPGDPRRAVAAVLDEIWQPVPYPAGGGRVRLAEEGRSARRRSARGGHASHAGFAALATVTIAAMTVVAAGTGAARMQGTAEPPPAVPVVIPGEDSTLPPAPASRPSRPPTTVGAHVPRPPVTVTATRTLPPRVPTPQSPGSPQEQPPPPPGAPPTAVPPPADQCFTRKGKPKNCPPGHTQSPVPSSGVTTEPQWGDGESPQPSPSPSSSSPVGSPPGTAAPPDTP